MKAGSLDTNPTKAQFKGIYDSSPDGILNFQTMSRCWENVERNLKREGVISGSTGARARNASKAKAKASDKALTPTSNKKKGPPGTMPQSVTRSETKAVRPTGMLTASPTNHLVWETLYSYWTDKDKNSRLQLLIVLPSGCRPKDIQVTSVSDGGWTLPISYTWPNYIFTPDRVFEGQTKDYGTNVATPGSAKASGLDAATEAMKPTNKSLVKTRFSVHLEKKVEETLVDLNGKPTTKPSFYKIKNDDWEQYPMLVMVVGMMIQRAVDDGFVEEQDEDQDFS